MFFAYKVVEEVSYEKISSAWQLLKKCLDAEPATLIPPFWSFATLWGLELFAAGRRKSMREECRNDKIQHPRSIYRCVESESAERKLPKRFVQDFVDSFRVSRVFDYQPGSRRMVHWGVPLVGAESFQRIDLRRRKS